jgi:hypothetical protein
MNGGSQITFSAAKERKERKEKRQMDQTTQMTKVFIPMQAAQQVEKFPSPNFFPPSTTIDMLP